jgi:aryl carrier-like protein
VRESAYVAPRNRVEAILAEVCAEVLRLPRMGVEDNFFAVGGDSIRTIQVVARCRQQGLHLKPQQMFRHQTIAALAAVLEEAEPAAARPVGDPLPDLPRETPVAKDGRFSPADFPRAALLQEELDEILEELG